MTTTAKVLSPTAFTLVAGTTVYTVPSLNTAQVWQALATNTSGGTVTVDIHIVPLAGAATTSNKVVSALSIPANKAVIMEELHNMILDAGMFVVVVPSVSNAITFTLSGTERT